MASGALGVKDTRTSSSGVVANALGVSWGSGDWLKSEKPVRKAPGESATKQKGRRALLQSEGKCVQNNSCYMAIKGP